MLSTEGADIRRVCADWLLLSCSLVYARSPGAHVTSTSLTRPPSKSYRVHWVKKKENLMQSCLSAVPIGQLAVMKQEGLTWHVVSVEAQQGSETGGTHMKKLV